MFRRPFSPTVFLALMATVPVALVNPACSGDSTTADSADADTDSDSDTDVDTDTDTDADTDADTDIEQPNVWSNGVLTHELNERVGPGSTWTGIAATDEYLYVTAKDRDHLWLFKLTFDLEVLGLPVQLTFDEDIPDDSKVADHKILIFEGNLYVGWNPIGLHDLYLLAFDLEGNRLFDQVTVERLTDVPTTDVHLTSDGTYLYLLYGDSGEQRRVAVYDTDGTTIAAPEDVDFNFRLDQLGTTVFADDRWNMFTGDEDTNNLVVSFFNHDWTPQSPFSEVLIEEEDHDYNWFPTGVALSEAWDLWLVLYHNMPEESNFDDDATIELALFDRNFKLREEHFVGPPDFHSADITAVEGCVFVATAFGDIYVDRYAVNPPDDWPEGADPPSCASPDTSTGTAE